MGGFSPALELILILSAHMQIRNNPVVKVVVEITFFGKNLHSVDSAHLDLTTMSILVCVSTVHSSVNRTFFAHFFQLFLLLQTSFLLLH